jgi:hypothetical protein
MIRIESASSARWERLVRRLVGRCTVPKDSVAGRREFERIMEARPAQDDPQARKAVRRGWCLGSEEFRRELLEQMEGRMGRHHGGVERQETAEQRAARLVAEELKRRGWDGGELKRRKKGDRAKAQIV